MCIHTINKFNFYYDRLLYKNEIIYIIYIIDEYKKKF